MHNPESHGEWFRKARQQMLEFDLKGRGIGDEEVLRAMGEVAREAFVPEGYLSNAYDDGPLPIGCGQTISQPYIVALMTEALKVTKDCEVLEIGTGSGYQTAILCKLAKKVYTVERFAELSESAQVVLGKLGIKNVEFYVGDGTCGWPEEKSFERVMITAAAPSVPVLEQLKVGGFVVAPIGFGGAQRLVVCEKKQGGLEERFLCDVRFVRLIGEYGFRD